MSGVEQIAQRFFEDVLTARNSAAADALVAEHFVDHDSMPMQAKGRDGLLAAVGSMHEALPDCRYEALLLIPDGSKVAVRWRMTGTNSGSLFGREPTGRAVDVTGVDVLAFRDDRVHQRWSKWERHLLLAQLGITPPVKPKGG